MSSERLELERLFPVDGQTILKIFAETRVSLKKIPTKVLAGEVTSKKHKQESVIERLRRENPGRNVASVAVSQLDQPADMGRFLIEYAQELGRASERPETKANPFDTAVELINRMANLQGGEIAKRWFELIDTGTVLNPPVPLPPFLSRVRINGGE